MVINFVFQVSLITFQCILLGHAADISSDCQQEKRISVPAYSNWPFRVDCNHLEQIWRASPNATAGDQMKCNITHNGFNYTAGVFEVTSESDGLIYNVELIVNGRCGLRSDVEIKLQSFPEGECQDLINEAALRGETISQSSTIGDYVVLRCIPPAGTPTLIPEGVNRDDFETYWYTTCKRQPYRDNNLWSVDRDPDGYPDTLVMPRVDFYDATNFTCSVTYKRRTLYPITYSQCIKQTTDMKDPTVTCTKEETERRGGTAELDCAAQIATGTTPSEDFVVEWMQNDKVICRNSFFNKTAPGLLNNRISCIVEGNNDSVVCVENGETIPEEEIQRQRKKLELRLNISDLGASDFVNYSVVVRFRHDGKWLQGTPDNITLVEDRTPFYEKVVIGLSSAFAILIFFAFSGVLIWHFRIYILVAYKRSNLTKYDKDDKKWVAYLSYYFDGSPDTEAGKKSSKATKEIVSGIHKVMERLNFSYYDEQKQNDFSVAVEKITNLVENCHRMILVLTPEYLNDKWRRFHAELGWHALLESHIGLVFVVTPGVKKLLEKRAGSDNVWKNLLVALKTYRVINWRESMSEDELMRHIEYAMPKLRTSERLRRLHIPEYARTLSQSTACTMLTPDTPPLDRNNYL